MTVEYDVAVIGSVLLEPGYLMDVLEYVDVDDFSSKMSKDIFATIKALYFDGEPVDPVIVRDKLRSKFDEHELNQFLISCSYEPTAANAVEYAKALRNQSRIAQLQRIGIDMQYSINSIEWESVAAEYVGRIQALVDGDKHTSINGGVEWYKEFMKREELIISDPERAYVRTGFNALDRTLGGGLFNSGMYVVGARPGMGKTTLAINIAENVAKAGKPVLFISLEMSSHQIMCKRVAMDAEISYESLMNGSVRGSDIDRMRESVKRLSDRPMAVNEQSGLTAIDISLLAQKVKDCALIVVDYLGLVRPSNATKNRYEDYTNISADIKLLAKKMDIPILVLCQLNRANTGRSDKRPMLSDLRDTGAIEQDADAVLLLHREEYYNTEEGQPHGDFENIEIIVAKNRHGNTGTVDMMWNGAFSQIATTEKEDYYL